MVALFERMDDYVVVVNHYPYHRTEVIDKKKGIVRVYGRDGDKEKINYVRYSKKNYTREYLEENVLPKYEGCPLCRIGKEITESPKKISLDTKKTNPVVFSLLAMGSIPIVLHVLKKKLTPSI